MSRLLTLVVCLAATGALAKPRIAVMAFEGPKAAKVKAQVSKQLCAKFTCVTPKKGDDVQVDAVVTGEVTKKSVSIKVYVDEETEPVSKSIALSAGKLSKKGLVVAPSLVREALKNVEAEEEDSAGEELAAAP